jgi:HAD superfamily hydrolase (TIGR01509 family)
LPPEPLVTAMAFDLVIFDCDGVLIDSELLSIEADLACLAEDGIEISAEEILERYTGISMAGMLADLEVRHGCSFPDFAARHRRRLEALFVAGLKPIDGVAEVLAAIECKACVASSATPERLRHALTLVGLFDRLHPHIFSTVEVAHGKPAPDLFLHAATQMAAEPRCCVVIEDSAPGVIAAVAAGMTTIGFTGGAHCRPGHDARLFAEGAALVIGGMAQLPSALAQLGQQTTR